jgi:mannose-6-phosphate isomerase-like protein (cupin superfamily)
VNLQTYIESGILELYVLDLLDESANAQVQDMLLKHPDLIKEAASIEKALEDYALQNAIEPTVGLRGKIEQVLFSTTGNNLSREEIIPINERSDHLKWYNFVVDSFPEALHTENFAELIADADGWKQMLVVSSVDIEEESHADEYESFLILKGKCRCIVDGDVFYLEPGGYTEIPLKTNHRVEVVEGPVMAVVQYRALV